MKRDPKLNPFDPRNPEYWFRKRLITVVKVEYQNSIIKSPGQWGYNPYLFEPPAVSLVTQTLINDWNERTYEDSFDPPVAEQELIYMCNNLAKEYKADPELVMDMINDLDADVRILDKIKETKNMINNKIIH